MSGALEKDVVELLANDELANEEVQNNIVETYRLMDGVSSSGKKFCFIFKLLDAGSNTYQVLLPHSKVCDSYGLTVFRYKKRNAPDYATAALKQVLSDHRYLASSFGKMWRITSLSDFCKYYSGDCLDEVNHVVRQLYREFDFELSEPDQKCVAGEYDTVFVNTRTKKYPVAQKSSARKRMQHNNDDDDGDDDDQLPPQTKKYSKQTSTRTQLQHAEMQLHDGDDGNDSQPPPRKRSTPQHSDEDNESPMPKRKYIRRNPKNASGVDIDAVATAVYEKLGFAEVKAAFIQANQEKWKQEWIQSKNKQLQALWE